MKLSIRSYLIIIAFLLHSQILQVVAQTANTNLGTGAGNAGSSNTSIGYYAGDVVTVNMGTFIGAYSGRNNTSGWQNTFVGASSGTNNTTGEFNTFLGANSGYSNNAGYNTFIGQNSGRYNTTGSVNTFIGSGSGIGNTAGSNNIGLGSFSAGQATGSNNISLGTRSGYSNSSGNNNIFLGHEAGYNTAGSSNIFIGFQAGYSEVGANKLYIDNSSTSTPLIYGDFATNQVGINALPSTYTLNIGGTLNATSLYINGQPFSSTGVWQPATGVIYNNTANVGIGTMLTNNPNAYKLAVNGKIGAKEVQIENNSLTWSDFVFKKDYKLPTLIEVETFIQANGHLKDIPSEKEVKEKGIELAEMNAKLLQKIEELTLYVIELRKEVDGLKRQVKK